MDKEQLEKIGVTVELSPSGCTLVYPGLYATAPTFDEAAVKFLEETLKRLQLLEQWKEVL